MGNQDPTAALLIIGNEILSGRTQDLNLNYIAKELNKQGIRFLETRVIPDHEGTIVEYVNILRKKYDYVFTTGGIGPTHDDITAAAIAKAFKAELERNQKAVERVAGYYKEGELNDARLKMADIPKGGRLIDNPVSSAPGFIIQNVYVMAGVPKIMQAMFDGIKHTLKGGKKMLSEEITVSLSESQIASDLKQLQSKHAKVEIGSYPFMREGKIGLSIVIRTTERDLLDNCLNELRVLLEKY